MRGSKNFSFKWKLVENYAGAAVGALFMWFFVNGIVNKDDTSMLAAIVILVVAPFLISFVDRKSTRSN